MTTESGFYKEEDGETLFAPNFIIFPDRVALTRETRDQFEYPFRGWEWRGAESDAVDQE